MGARRSARARARVNCVLVPGDVVLTTPEGELLLSLNPLCQLLVPAPGAGEEIFLFDGPSRFGAKLVSFPIGFERYDNRFWDWYRDNLVEFDLESEGAADDSGGGERPPYMGLATFSPQDADNYFGREREVHDCVNRLRVMSLLAVVGPSGAGKSSFVQAGIVPAMPRDWRAITVRPGPNPLIQLVARLTREGFDDVVDLRARLEKDIDALGAILRTRAIESGEPILLVIDQFEELLTLCLAGDIRSLYAEALMAAARGPDDPVRVIITLRDDFLVRAQQLPALSERLGHSLQILGTPPPVELQRIVIEPARRAGYQFEDAKLPKEMVAAVADEPGALALLSFTASKLWELRDRKLRQLPRRAYKSLGGVGGALAQHAEETLEEMPVAHRVLVREVFRQLVTADGTRAVLTRSELEEILGGDDTAGPILEALIGARLLVASEGEGGEDRVEVIHEALLSSWPRLVGWQREDAESARLRDQLRAAARQWDERDRPGGLLWRGDALLEYRVWRARYQGSLTEVEKAFARASQREETRGKKRRRIAAISAFAILAIGLVIMFGLQRRAASERERADHERQRAEENATQARSYAAKSEKLAEESKARLLDLYIEQGRQALDSRDPMRAFVYFAEARKEGADNPALRFMLSRAIHAMSGQLLVIPAHDGPVHSMAVSSDGSRIASGGHDYKVRIWDAATGAMLADLTGHSGIVWSVQFSPDGRYLASSGRDGQVRVWDTSTGELAWSGKHDAGISVALFSSDGAKLVTASRDNTARIWDARTGAVLRTLTGHSGKIRAAALTPDDRYIVTAAMDRSACVWDMGTGRTVAISGDHDGIVGYVGISPDGTRAVTGTWGKSARLIPIGARRPGVPRSLVGHEASIRQATFSPDGERLVTASEDQTARVWDVDTGEEFLEITGHSGGVTAALFSPDGRRIATTSRDRSARLWDAGTGQLIWTYVGHHDGLWVAEYSRSGDRLVTGSFDGTVRLWDPEQTDYAVALPEAGVAVRNAALDPKGQRIAVAHQDGSVRVWDAAGAGLYTLETGQERGRVEWSPDGERLVTAGGNSAIVWGAQSKAKLLVLSGHTGEVTHAAFAPGGDRIVTTSLDKTARLWDARSGQLLHELTGHTGPLTFASFDPAGRLVVTASYDKSARIWDARNGAPVRTLEKHKIALSAAVFSADSKFVVTASHDQTAIVWTIEGEVSTLLEGHRGSVVSAAFSPDGHLVATTSDDGAMSVWDRKSGTRLWTVDLAAHGESIEFSRDGLRLLVGSKVTAKIWAVPYDDQELDELEHFAACRVYYALEQGRVKKRANLTYDGCNDR